MLGGVGRGSLILPFTRFIGEDVRQYIHKHSRFLDDGSDIPTVVFVTIESVSRYVKVNIQPTPRCNYLHPIKTSNDVSVLFFTRIDSHWHYQN